MHIPKLSIIVPLFNSEDYLKKCIESILNQKFSDFELILVDDGSTDTSGQICDIYSKFDNRVSVYHKVNEGQASARNLGLDVAKGELISFIDSDDYIANDMYQILVNSISKFGADIAVCGRNNVDERTGELSPFFVTEEEMVWDSVDAFRRLLVWDGIDSSPCDKVFLKELFSDIRFPTGYICEDVAVLYKLISKSSIIVQIGKPLYFYLQRSGSTSKSLFSEKTKGLIFYYRSVYDYCLGEHPELIKEAEYFYFVGVKCALGKYIRTKTWTDKEWINIESRKCLQIVRDNELISLRDKALLYLFKFDSLKILYRLLKGIF